MSTALNKIMVTDIALPAAAGCMGPRLRAATMHAICDTFAKKKRCTCKVLAKVLQVGPLHLRPGPHADWAAAGSAW